MRYISMCFLLSIASAADAQDRPFATFDLASDAVLNDPHDVEIGPDGNLYIADKFGDRVVVMDPETLEVLWTFGDGALPGAHDVSFDAQGRAYVSVTGLSQVDIFAISDQDATRVGTIPGVARTEGVLAHSNGRVYVMASGTGHLIGFEGENPVVIAQGFFGAHDVAEAPDGTIWLADNAARRLVHLDEDLKILKVLDHSKFGFVGPRYLDIDEFGQLVVADQDAHRVLLIDPAGPDGGTLLGVLGDGIPGIGPGKFDDPEGALVHQGRYFFADSDNNRIVRYSVVLN